jgi:putative tryptophan/tyrosine transport system substrate-binding protein
MARLEHGATMRRREFVTGVGVSALVGPRGAWGQQASKPVVGFLRSTTLAEAAHLITAFRRGLKEAGYTEGQNVSVEYRSAGDHQERLPSLAAELIGQRVAVILGNNLAALVAKAATPTIPIVFVTGGDPVSGGLVTSLNRPGGNVTGVTFLGGVVGAKRLELLRLLVPKAIKIGMLVSPNYPDTEAEREDVKAGTQRTTQPIILEIRDGDELDGAFAALIAQGVEALMVGTGAFLFSRRSRIAALAAKYRLPASYSNREGVEAGGLMSYGPSIADAYRQGGIYVGRVLNGEKPADLPVMQSGKFEFVLNLKTAKDLGLEFHPQLLATADEVIE